MTLYIRNINTFIALEAQLKTIEVRIYRGFIKTLNIGDDIEIKYTNISSKFKIIDIRIYNNFETILNSESLSKIMPYVNTIEEGLHLLNSYYKKNNNHRVVAIYLSKV